MVSSARAKRLKIVCGIFLQLCSFSALAQNQVKPVLFSQDSKSSRGFSRLLVNNTSGSIRNATLQINITDSSGGQIADFDYTLSEIPGGISQIKPEGEEKHLSLKEEKVKNFYLKFGCLPPGLYSYRYLVKDSTGKLWAQQYIVFTQRPTLNPVIKSESFKDSKKGKGVSINWLIGDSSIKDIDLNYDLSIYRLKLSGKGSNKDSTFYLHNRTHGTSKAIFPDKHAREKDSMYSVVIRAYYGRRFIGQSLFLLELPKEKSFISKWVAAHSRKKELPKELTKIGEKGKVRGSKFLQKVGSILIEKNAQPSSESDTIKKKSFIAGNVDLKGELELHRDSYTGSLGYNNALPNPYLYVRASETLTMGIIPIHCNLFYSNLPLKDGQQFHAISFSFDQAEFQKVLTKKLYEASGLDDLQKYSKEDRFQIERELNALKGNPIDTQRYRRDLETRIDSIRKHQINIPDTSVLRSRTDTLGMSRNFEDSIRSSISEENLSGSLKKYNEIQADYKKQMEAASIQEKRIKELEGKLKKINQLDSLNGDLDERKLRDPSVFKKKLNDYDILKGPSKYLLGIRKVQYGRIFPEFSPNILKFKAIDGFNTELQLGKAYINGLDGKLSQYNSTFGYTMAYSNEESHVSGIKAGIGEPTSNHFYLLAFQSIANKMTVQQSWGEAIVPHYNNTIIGFNSKVKLFKSLNIETEALRSRYYLALEQFNPSRYGEIFKLKNDIGGISAVKEDYAVTTKLSYLVKSTKTKVDGTIYHIGPKFYSAGVSYMRKGDGYGVNLQQPLFRNHVRLNGFYKLEMLNDGFGNGMSIGSYGVQGDITYDHLPSITFTLNPGYYTGMNAGGGHNMNHSDRYALSVYQGYKVKKNTFFTNLTYSLMQQGPFNEALTSRFSLISITQTAQSQQKVLSKLTVIFRLSTELAYSDQVSYATQTRGLNSVVKGDIQAGKLSISGTYKIFTQYQTSEAHGSAVSFIYTPSRYMSLILMYQKNNYINQVNPYTGFNNNQLNLSLLLRF